MPHNRIIASLALYLALAGMASAQGLPGGATSLNESHGDWTVACAAPDGVARCTVSQSLMSAETSQRVLTIELFPSQGGDTVSGMLALPFGLDLDAGARRAIDDAGALPPLRFSTCLPVGCLAPLAFDEEASSMLKAGTILSVSVTAYEGGREITFPIPLSGLASALTRLADLAGAN